MRENEQYLSDFDEKKTIFDQFFMINSMKTMKIVKNWQKNASKFPASCKIKTGHFILSRDAILQ